MITAYAIISSIVGGMLGTMVVRHLQKRAALEAKAEKLSLSQDIYGPHANIDVDGKRK